MRRSTSAPLPYFAFLRRWDPRAGEETLERAALTSPRRESRGGFQGPESSEPDCLTYASSNPEKGSHFHTRLHSPNQEGKEGPLTNRIQTKEWDE